MSWSRKFLAVFAALAVGSAMLGAKKEDKAKEPGKSEKQKDGDKKKEKSGKPATKSKETSESASNRLPVPLPIGEKATKLVIPYRDGVGKLQMRFTMDLGRRVDADHLEMSQLLIETYDDLGKLEMSIDLPDSSLELNTRVITTKSGVTIKRSDFELSGQTMEFNTVTKRGRLAGRVHMKIYNRDDETDPAAESTAEEKTRAN